jgi:hypothetical protein
VTSLIIRLHIPLLLHSFPQICRRPFRLNFVSRLTGLIFTCVLRVSFAVAATSSSDYPFTNRRGQSLALRPLNHSPLCHAKQIEVIIMQFDGEKD